MPFSFLSSTLHSCTALAIPTPEPAAMTHCIASRSVSLPQHPRFRSARTLARIAVGVCCAGLMEVSALTVDNIYPNSGPLATATQVVIIGTGLTGATAVAIDGVAVTGLSVDSDTQITATITPNTTVGLKDVTVDAGTLSNGFTFTESSTTTVQVTITASIQAMLALAWTGNTTGVLEGATSAIPWAIGAVASGTVVNTDSNATGVGLEFEVRNVGNGPQKFTVSSGASDNGWTLAAAAGADAFGLAVSDGANVVGPTWLALTAVRTLNAGANVAVNGTAAFDLRFAAPIFDSTRAVQTITVTVTAIP